MSVWTQWTHAPLPDAACLSVYLTGSDNKLSFGETGPPTRCEFSDSAACGQNGHTGRCVSLRSLYDASWSRDADDDDNICWFLAYLEGRDVVADPSATYGICQCLANFDGDNCDVCRAGWAGTKCDEPYTAVRRPLEAYSSSEMPDIQVRRATGGSTHHRAALGSCAKRASPALAVALHDRAQAAFGEIDAGIDDLVPEGGLVDWMHTTVVMDYPDECAGWPHNPHKGSIWLMQWHRPLLRFTEAGLVARGLEGLPYWNTTAPDAHEAAYALHPELRALRPGCPAVSVWGIAQALGVGSSNILAECKGYEDPLDEERCLEAYGITIASIFDEEALLGYDYAPFLEGVKHMHVYVHCWFVAAGYVTRGCNDGTAAEMIRGATGISEAEAEACAAMPTKYVGVGDDSPLFFIFHTYLDALLEKWRRHVESRPRPTWLPHALPMPHAAHLATAASVVR